MVHERNCNTIEINAALVYTQVTLCWQDPSVSGTAHIVRSRINLTDWILASVPILREAAGVTWDILNSVKVINVSLP